MYFDDVSRYSLPWEPSDRSGDEYDPNISIEKLREIEIRAAQDKVEAMRRMLGGYDWESAMKLSKDEVKDEICKWASSAGLTGDDFEEEVYKSILWMNVCEAESLAGVIFGFWQAVSDMIMVEKICDAESIEWKNNNNIQNTDCQLEEKVYLIVIPNCQQLYKYKTMKIIHSALEFCESLCIDFGTKFKLKHYHPTYKNAPKMLHPKDNSPFPCFGLEFKSEDENKFESMLDEVDQQYIDDDILQEQRNMLENLFRDASAFSTSNSLKNLAYQKIENLSDDDVIKLSHDWIEQTKVKLNDVGYSRKLFQNLENINKWTIIDNKYTEEIYTEVWKAIAELIDTSTKNTTTCEIFSTMLVFKKFHVNNSETFKRFAITINATLKLIMDANQYMEMEIFHPEYLGKKEKRDYIRQSPFPSMQLIFYKNKSIQKEET